MNTPMIDMNRRQCLQTLGGISLSGLSTPCLIAAPESGKIQHLPLSLLQHPDLHPPEGLVTGFLRFGWKAFAVGNSEEGIGVLKGLGESAPKVPETAVCRLRLTTALDVRDAYRIDVATPGGDSIGEFDLRFAGLYQVQEIPLTPQQARLVLAEGAVLKMAAGPGPVWFFAPSPKASPHLDPLQLPHVLIASPDEDVSLRFEERLEGLVMLQGFGWQSGCVSEGILDLAETRTDKSLLEAVDRYLAMYFTADGVAFETPRSHPLRDRVGGIEEPLPWATLARRQPDHPAIEIGRKFLSSDSVSKHDLSGEKTLTTEGCYTAAYPTAVLSKVLQKPELATIALRQLEVRRLVNVHEGDIYQRASTDGSRRLRNWCRGVCWYYLGVVRTIAALEDESAVEAWLPEIRRVSEFLLGHQREDGLWGNFLHDPGSLADTSGSAGLAAALAYGHALGWLPVEARESAIRALAGLRGHLTPDGLLGGAAQSNKGGDSLQQGDYRVIYQMGMGLKAQLIAALELVPSP